MQRFTLRILFLLLVLALVGCKKSKDSDATPAPSVNENAEHDEADDGPLRVEIDAELLHTFEDKLVSTDDRRPEDNTPVKHHEYDLQEGDRIYVEMEALDPFRTYLLIATPNRTGGYQNSECYPGQGLSSCVRFVADQTGTYLFMANAATTRSKGRYTLKIYKETEEQAKANAAAHAIVTEKSEQRLQKHLAEQKKEREARKAARKKAKEDAERKTPTQEQDADKAVDEEN